MLADLTTQSNTPTAAIIMLPASSSHKKAADNIWFSRLVQNYSFTARSPVLQNALPSPRKNTRPITCDFGGVLEALLRRSALLVATANCNAGHVFVYLHTYLVMPVQVQVSYMECILDAQA